MDTSEPVRVAYWYFGGLACTAAASITHPLDLLKVHMQTSSTLLPVTSTPTSSSSGNSSPTDFVRNGKSSSSGTALSATRMSERNTPGMLSTCTRLVRNQGFTALYAGLTACWLKQLTYSTARFAFYEILKEKWPAESKNTLISRLVCSAVAGAAGGLIGAPADLINIRMQNDTKLPAEQRRNYKHALDGLYRIIRQEGPFNLFNGATMATCRAVLLTIGQLCMYDQCKHLLLDHSNGLMQDNLITHFSASLMAGAIATTITHPLDVVKVRMMNAPPSASEGIFSCIVNVVRNAGPFGFFKGYIPAFIRLGPQTILTFVFFEQLRLNFGYIKQK